MTGLLTRLLGRLPIGWLQLFHNKTRLFAAVGGVMFANILIFMQLGFLGALRETSVLAHRTWNADIVIVSSDFQSLRTVNSLPRSRMHQALQIEGVKDVVPVYFSTINWTDPGTNQIINFRAMGIPAASAAFLDTSIQEQVRRLSEPLTALVDVETRQLDPKIVETIKSKGICEIEVKGRKMHLTGTFSQGASIDIDGTLIMSDQTFFEHFPSRSSGTPSLIFVQCESAGPDSLQPIVEALNRVFPETDVKAYTKDESVVVEHKFQTKQTPVGFVFSFGVVIGFIVGLVIVYQVLTTDVQDHLAEYATFKAIGYRRKFFSGIILEEALSLAALGFVPGMIVSLALYHLAETKTALPMEMPWSRLVLVFILTVAMCAGSGMVATKKLSHAQPADLF